MIPSLCGLLAKRALKKVRALSVNSTAALRGMNFLRFREPGLVKVGDEKFLVVGTLVDSLQDGASVEWKDCERLRL